MSKGGLLAAFKEYLVSPIRGRRLPKGRGALEALGRAGALLAGESALPYYSDLARGASVARVALWHKGLAEVRDGAGGGWAESGWYEAPDVVVEEWAYQIDGANGASRAAAGFGALDALGLYAEMRGAGDGDVRLADAVAQLREAACQR